MESTWTDRRKQKKSKQKNMNHYKAFKHCKKMYVRVYLSYVFYQKKMSRCGPPSLNSLFGVPKPLSF